MMNSSGLRDRVRKKNVNNTVFISKVIEYQKEMNDSKKEKIKSYTQYILFKNSYQGNITC